MSAGRLLSPLLAAMLLGGCFRSTIHSGLPPSDPPERYHELWHSGWFGGALEASGPHDLAGACPDGWAQIETSTDASQGLVTLVTLGIYAPQTVTIVCARGPSNTAPEPPKATGF